MGYILISVLALIVGFVLVYFAIEEDWCDFLIGVGTIILFYGIFSLLPYFLHDNLDNDLTKYEKAKFKLEVIENSEEIPMSVLSDFKESIDSMNELIDKSAKYHDNWFLGPFYYKEIGELDKLVLSDTIQTKILFR